LCHLSTEKPEHQVNQGRKDDAQQYPCHDGKVDRDSGPLDADIARKIAERQTRLSGQPYEQSDHHEGQADNDDPLS